ncbi:MAG: riboflavin biosynthesis protein RibF, partial [Proteobacteria bacterium]|nr:riboflavin biosynthesis protein RibF [Pseudomonadota bacterium]
DNLFVIDFNKDNANLTASNFIRALVNDLQIKHLIVGNNFYFGAKRRGDIQTLEKAQSEGKFDLTVVELLKDLRGETISSSRIRGFLHEGNIKEANRLLGWDWQVESEVIKGDKRGRQLGYPTANQKINEYIKVPFGVYLTKIKIENEDKWRYGISNFGIRPTFKSKTVLLETHIFDFNKEIYGKKIRTVFVERIRREKNFSSREDLINTIEEDCTKAKAVLKSA